MESVFMFLFVLVSIMLLTIILLQSGKGGMGSAISGQSMNEAFGGEGADKLLVKLTGFLAFTFMVLAIVIGKYDPQESIFDKVEDEKIELEDNKDASKDKGQQ